MKIILFPSLIYIIGSVGIMTAKAGPSTEIDIFESHEISMCLEGQNKALRAWIKKLDDKHSEMAKEEAKIFEKLTKESPIMFPISQFYQSFHQKDFNEMGKWDKKFYLIGVCKNRISELIEANKKNSVRVLKTSSEVLFVYDEYFMRLADSVNIFPSIEKDISVLSDVESARISIEEAVDFISSNIIEADTTDAGIHCNHLFTALGNRTLFVKDRTKVLNGISLSHYRSLFLNQTLSKM